MRDLHVRGDDEFGKIGKDGYYEPCDMLHVWCSLSNFGYSVPWPHWHDRGIYPIIPTDRNSSYVYVYYESYVARSRKNYRPAKEVFAKAMQPGGSMQNCIGLLDASSWLEEEDIDWIGLAKAILNVWMTGIVEKVTREVDDVV